MKKFAVFTEIAAINKASQVIRKIVRDLKPMANAARGVNRAWAKTSKSGGVLLGRMRNIGLAAGVAGGAVLAFAKKSSGSAAKIRDDADKLGVSVEEFQKYAFVANQAGIETTTFATGMQRLNRRIADAAGGKNKNLAALFDKLGISLRGADGELRTSLDLQPELAAAFKANENAAIRTSMAFAFFDSEGVPFQRFLNDGTEALLKMLAAAEDTGQVMGGETLRRVAALDDRFTSLAGTVRTLGIAITGELAGGINDAITSIQNFLGDGEKKEKLLASIAAAATATKAAMIGFSDAVSAAMPVIQGIVEAMGGWENVGIAIAALLGIKLVASVALFVASLAGLGKALAVLALTNPFTALVAAAVVATVAIIAHWDRVSAAIEGVWLLAQIGALKVAKAIGAVLPDFVAVKLGIDAPTLAAKLKALASRELIAQAKALGLGKASTGRQSSIRGVRAGFADAAASVGRQGLRGIFSGRAALPALPMTQVRDTDNSGLKGIVGALREFRRDAVLAPPPRPARAQVEVTFRNVPEGTRVNTPRAEGLDIKTDLGFSQAGVGF